jgi:hypothetical protein
MSKMTLEEALAQLDRTDATFYPEVRKRLAPVKDRFFSLPAGRDPHAVVTDVDMFHCRTSTVGAHRNLCSINVQSVSRRNEFSSARFALIFGFPN